MDKNTPQFRIVIPARYDSQRLPGKPLLPIAGEPMLAHVYRCAVKSGALEVVVATDDERIGKAAAGFSADVCMTSSAHRTGTDRIAEVVRQKNWADDNIVVNLQGDEPLMPIALIEQVAANLHKNVTASIATLCARLDTSEAQEDSSNVKVVFDTNGLALYFSRAAIPFCRDSREIGNTNPYRHIGLYAYRVSFLKAFATLAECEIERQEKLEQLRALWYGYKIHVAEAVELPGPDVNTVADLSRVETVLNSR